MEEKRLLLHEWSFHDRRNARIAAALERWPPGSATELIRRRLERRLGNVVSHPVDYYTIPQPTVEVIGTQLAEELSLLLATICEVNSQYMGLPVRDLHVLFSGNHFVAQMQIQLMNWSSDYILARRERCSGTDGVDPVASFYRGFEEVRFLFDLSSNSETIHSLFLEMPNQFLMWLLAATTWLPDFRFIREPGHDVAVYSRIRGADAKRECLHLIDVMGLSHHDSLEYCTQLVKQSLGAMFNSDALDVAAARSELKRLADDLLDMRPFLIRNFNPMRAIVSLNPECWFVFEWGMYGNIGTVFFGTSERDVREQYSRAFVHTPLLLRYDGRLACEVSPWTTAFETPSALRRDAITMNLALVRALYDRLLEFFSRVDISRFLLKALPQAFDGSLSEQDEDAFVAASIALAPSAEEDEPNANGEEDEETHEGCERTQPWKVVTSMRLSRLRSVLEKLGCEIGHGKGSEIKVYRVGGKPFILPHHEGNKAFAAGWIRQLMRRVGITPSEWASALGYNS